VKTLLYSLVLLTAFHSYSAAQTYSALHNFPGYPSTDGIYPLGSLIRDGQGTLYGTTYGGGFSYVGAVYKVDSSGNESILYNFTGGADGEWPQAGLVEDTDHTLYGTASAGGQSGCGARGHGCGVVFKLSAGGEFSVLHTFTGGADGAIPVSPLIRDGEGNLYGTASQGGSAGCVSNVSSGCGTVFKLSPKGELTVLHSFTGNSDGGAPLAGLLRDEAGNLFGTASIGGSFARARCKSLGGCGTVFRISDQGKFSVLYRFKGYPVDGDYPTAGLIRDSKGNLFGASNDSPYQSGEIFKLDQTGHETVLFVFPGYPWPDGASSSTLVRDAKGNFYGTSGVGGTGGWQGGYCLSGCGTVFKLDP